MGSREEVDEASISDEAKYAIAGATLGTHPATQSSVCVGIATEIVNHTGCPNHEKWNGQQQERRN